jgi:tetratricopeptide (TPR) repeat protein
LSAWQRVTAAARADVSPGPAVRTAEQLGAGRVLVGSVAGSSTRLVLTAEMLAVPSGATVATASVSGTADSLPALVDRLGAALLLGSDPAVGPAARSVLGATPLAGIRDYVEGQTAYRLGHYDDAVRRFSRALATDSTFAPAALGLARAVGWTGTMLPVIDRAAQLAWAHRDRLTPPARLALLASFGGPDALGRGYVPDTAAIAAWERAAEADPDNPEMWYQVGDRYLHLGPEIGIASSLERSQVALRRAVALDPVYTPAVVHLVQVAARLGDTATVRRVGMQLLRHDSTSEAAATVRWRMAVALGDSTALLALRARLAELPSGALHAILATAECDAVDLGDADRALAEMLRRAATPAERAFALLHAHAYALNRGRWGDALRATEALGDVDPAPRWHLRIRVLDALYAGGDSSAGRAAADSLQRFAVAPLASDAHAREAQYEDIAVVTQWQLWHGDRHGLARALDHLTSSLRKPPRDRARRVVANRIAAALLGAIAANTNGARNLAAIERLDTLLVTESAATYDWPRLYPNLAAARLFALNGRADRALAAARRRVPFFPEGMYLSASLAMEARLSAQLGDTAGAAAAQRRVEALESK